MKKPIAIVSLFLITLIGFIFIPAERVYSESVIQVLNLPFSNDVTRQSPDKNGINADDQSQKNTVKLAQQPAPFTTSHPPGVSSPVR